MTRCQHLKRKDKLKLLRTFLNGEIAAAFAVNVLLMIAVGIFPALVTGCQLRLFDSIGSVEYSLPVLAGLVLIFLLVQIAYQIAEYFFKKYNFVFSEKMKFLFQKQMFEKTEKLTIDNFDNAKFYDLLYRVRENGAENVIGAMTNWFDLAKNVIQVISISIAIGRIHWIFPALIITFSIPYVIFFRKMNFYHYFHLMNNSAKTRKNHYIIDILNKREYAKELRVFGLFSYFYDYHVRLRDELFEETYRLVKKYTFYAGIIGVCKRIVQVACFALGVFFTFEGKMGMGQYAVLYQTVTQIQSALLKVAECYKNQNNQQYHLEDIAEFKNLSEESQNTGAYERDEVAIHTEHVSFTYPHSEEVVLKDINLDIPFGQKVAIVGENGSGKTTFANLLAGLYLPTKGRILIDGQDMKELLPKWRESVGYIFQDFMQYKGTVRENTELGSSSEPASEEIEEVLKESGIWEFVEQLPQKEETMLGFVAKESRELSGGQWQKLAISRALLDKNRKILILDEFAASLDAFSEANLYKRFQQLTEGKTTISISHRLGITRFVDRILVFHKGQIVEDGTHEELMRKQGHYYAMYCAQRELYQ